MGKKSKAGGYPAEEAPVAKPAEPQEEEEEEEEEEPKSSAVVDEVDADDWDEYIKEKAELVSSGHEEIQEAVLQFFKKKGKKASEDKVVKSKFDPFEFDDETITIQIKIGREEDTYIVKTTVVKEAAENGDDEDGDEEEDDGDAKAKDDKKAKEPAEPKQPAGPFNLPFRPHTDYPPMEKAVIVEYCPITGLPPDFCQFSPQWEKCKPWVLKNYPQYHPELCDESLEEAEKKAAEANEKSKVKELPGGKKKREASPSVNIKKLSRGGRKCVTSIIGLEGFGVKLDDAAKLFKKKFACGSSVVKGDNAQPDSVDIQGDFEDEVVEIILKEYSSVPREKIHLLEGGTKKKGKGK